MTDDIHLTSRRADLIKMLKSFFEEDAIDKEEDLIRVAMAIEICMGLDTRDRRLYLINTIRFFCNMLRAEMTPEFFDEYLKLLQSDRTEIYLTTVDLSKMVPTKDKIH